MSETTQCACDRAYSRCGYPMCGSLSHRPATPPTPDLDGVVDALVRVLRAAPKQSAYLALALRCDDLNVHRIADALLAAVSRPTPQAAPEVTSEMMDEMIERGMQAWENTLSDREVSRAEVVAAILTAALRAGGTDGR